MDSSVAPAEDDAATLETIPGDALGVVQQFIGFHSSPAVSAVSTSLYKTEELAAARARQRLSLAVMPSLPSGPRNLRDCRLATEYLSLVPTTEGAQSRTIICAENYQRRAGQTHVGSTRAPETPPRRAELLKARALP